MAQNGDQQEIILGNKQLLSIFFVVVVLMGVSFTIGYVIGRNTSGVSAAASGAASGPRVAATPAPVSDGAQEARKEPAAESPQPKATEKTQDAPDGAPKGGAAAKTPASERQETTTASNGTYLQVASLKKEDASQLVKMLQGRKFPAQPGESPKEGLFRVLVGPYHDLPSLAEAKQKLRGAGFDPIVAR